MTVNLALAKAQLRVLHSDEDTLIAQHLAAAIVWVENYTGKLLTNREVSQEFDAFTPWFQLFYGPAPEELTITYTDTDDDPQTITDALIVRGRVYPLESWPGIADNSVILLEYTAGYATVPADLDAAVLLLVDEFFTGSSNMAAVEALCRPYRAVTV